jgi:dihydroorotate dehydrogenase
MDIYKNILRPLLFKLNAEDAHNLSVFFLKHNPLKKHSILKPKEFAGITFPNPIGLAAGFDKNAELINHAEGLGFGFIEIGTITPHPQEGNPKPRLFRNEKEESITNRMGFNNDGVYVIRKRLEERKTNIIIGANIGMNKTTPIDYAHRDYQFCFFALQELVDYFTINVSSPNTPNLRKLMEKDRLSIILEVVMNENKHRLKEKPIFVKISPDLNDDELHDVLDVCNQFEVKGIVATNTTSVEKGGLSGFPLEEKSREVIEKIKSYSDLPIIGCGGIMSPDIAKDRFDMGCGLIQIYTGLIYNGINFVKNISEKL